MSNAETHNQRMVLKVIHKLPVLFHNNMILHALGGPNEYVGQKDIRAAVQELHSNGQIIKVEHGYVLTGTPGHLYKNVKASDSALERLTAMRKKTVVTLQKYQTSKDLAQERHKIVYQLILDSEDGLGLRQLINQCTGWTKGQLSFSLLHLRKQNKIVLDKEKYHIL